MKRAVAILAALLAGPAIAAGMVTLRYEPDRAKTVAGADEAVVAVMFDNPERVDDRIVFQRYDIAARRLVVPVHGDRRAYGFSAAYARLYEDTRPVRVYVGVVPAGDYVLLGDVTGVPKTDSFCFGAPVLHVEAGSVSFVGGYRPSIGGGLVNRRQEASLAWVGDIAKARAALGGFPDIQDKLVAAGVRNGATFDCSGDTMWAYRVPGAPDLPPGG